MLNFNLDIQKQLLYAGLDDFCAAGMLSNSFGGPNLSQGSEWSIAVIELISLSMSASLIAPLESMGGYGARTAEGIVSLLKFGDLENGFDVPTTWNVIHFEGTKELGDILIDHQLYGWDSMNKPLSLSFGMVLQEMGIVEIL